MLSENIDDLKQKYLEVSNLHNKTQWNMRVSANEVRNSIFYSINK